MHVVEPPADKIFIGKFLLVENSSGTSLWPFVLAP